MVLIYTKACIDLHEDYMKDIQKMPKAVFSKFS